MAPSQFQHFVPQFILNNFSHKYCRQSSYYESALGQKIERKKKPRKGKIYPGNPALDIIDLERDTPQICESAVRRTFGLMDMYQDLSNVTDHNFLEKRLGQLESQAGKIIAEIRKAFESSRESVSISRDQRDLLRKFLFIMKYRGLGFHRRFRGDNSGTYIETDADQFKKYMRENGYHQPIDVWFHSIKTILDLRFDLQEDWKKELPAKIYPDDAFWFIMHMECYFLAFCTSRDVNDEFLVTENSYNIHEGPNSTVLSLETGEHEVTAWSSYHEFAPITPRLILVLRSALLPNPEEDKDKRIKALRADLYEKSRSFHVNPDTARSTLEDLPLKKPRNSYLQIVPQGIQLLPDEDGTRRSSHNFTFSFFQLDTTQVHRINSILLENAHATSAIVFRSTPSLKKSLEYYLGLPVESGFKQIGRADDPKLVYLRKLETIAKQLGSTVVMSFKELPTADEIEKSQLEMLRQFEEVLCKTLPQEPTGSMRLYQKLGM